MSKLNETMFVLACESQVKLLHHIRIGDSVIYKTQSKLYKQSKESVTKHRFNCMHLYGCLVTALHTISTYNTCKYDINIFEKCKQIGKKSNPYQFVQTHQYMYGDRRT